MLLAVRKGKDDQYGTYAAVFRCETYQDAAKLIGGEVLPGDISWGVERTGRWDSEDRFWAVFLAEPPEDWNLD